MRQPTVLDVRVLHQGWGRYLEVEVELPDGSRVRREVEDHKDAAGVLAFDPVRRTALLVRQLRAPMLLAAGEADSLEVIAGLLDGDDPADCARREAGEEAGVTLSDLDPVAAVWSMPGISTERIHLFLAAYSAADRFGPGGGLAHEGESTSALEIPLAELAAMADSGRLADSKTLLLLQALRLRRPELFAA